MNEEFKTPEFIKKQNFKDIMDEMIKCMPEDLDVSEGSHPYNLLAPTAMQLDYFSGYILQEAIKTIFPKYCDGDYDIANLHAEANGIKRKQAAHATGKLHINAPVETKIPAGSIFSTKSTDETPSIQFKTIEQDEIPKRSDSEARGSIIIDIEAVESGTAGNVKEGSICLSDDNIEGIHVEQLEPTAYGYDEETSEDLLKRVIEYEATQGASFIGNVADYKRWAEEVEGVGSASVSAATDSTGKIKIVIADANGQSQDIEALCEKVKRYILGTDINSEKRLAPINAYIEVNGAVQMPIYIQAKVYKDSEVDLKDIKTNFFEIVKPYILNSKEKDRELKYSKIAAMLSGVTGVGDYKELGIGIVENETSASNIPIIADAIPTIDINHINLTSA